MIPETAAAPTASATQSSTEPTEAPTETATPQPSATPTRTLPPTATFSPSHTPTLGPTLTAIPSATPTPLTGPVVTAFGLADASGTLVNPAGTDNNRPIFQTQFGSGFIIYVEGRPGPSGLDVGATTFNRSPFDPSVRPDLQLEASRDLGDGSAESCDNSAPTLGGIPGINPADFALTQHISDALNDFGCRFSVFDQSQFPCTQDSSANFAFINPNTTLQFCMLISTATALQSGDTILTAHLRDTGGNTGADSSIIVRVVQGPGT